MCIKRHAIQSEKKQDKKNTTTAIWNPLWKYCHHTGFVGDIFSKFPLERLTIRDSQTRDDKKMFALLIVCKYF